MQGAPAGRLALPRGDPQHPALLPSGLRCSCGGVFYALERWSRAVWVGRHRNATGTYPNNLTHTHPHLRTCSITCNWDCHFERHSIFVVVALSNHIDLKYNHMQFSCSAPYTQICPS